MGISSAQADSEWRVGTHGGYSQYTGYIGVEIQKNQYAFTVGLPNCLGMKYYFSEKQKNWFIGINAFKYSFEEPEKKDGVEYDELKETRFGGGFGYKWGFSQNWDITLGLTLFYNEEEYINDSLSRNDKNIKLYPDLTIGFSF